MLLDLLEDDEQVESNYEDELNEDGNVEDISKDGTWTETSDEVDLSNTFVTNEIQDISIDNFMNSFNLYPVKNKYIIF